MLCRHCQQRLATRPRGLCWPCYQSPDVRARYPSTSKFVRRGLGLTTGQVLPLPLPTKARPGSPEKVAILRQRAELRQELWHPDDATLWDNPEWREVG